MGESNFTPNYQFEQPHEDAFYDVGVSNRNMEKIDTLLKRQAVSLAQLVEYLNYMPINGGDFDGNDNQNLTIDGGTY